MDRLPFFLVTPKIFQRYVAERLNCKTGAEKNEAWRQLQRNFERIGLHRKRDNGQNIWACTVKGPRKTSTLNGYLLSNANLLNCLPPPDNPYLSLQQ